LNNIAGSASLTANSGTTNLTGLNTYTGPTTINNTATVTGSNANAFSAGSSTTINTGGTANLGGVAQTINSVTLAGGLLTNGSLTGVVNSTGGTVNNIPGSASLTANSGTTNLTGLNTYTGPTTINNTATVIAGNASAFSAASAATINTGGTANLGGFGTAFKSVALAGGTITNGATSGAITSTGGTVNNIGGFAASLTANSGTTNLTGANTLGPTTINNTATVTGGNANAFSANSLTTINTGGTANLGGFAQIINSVALAGGTITNGTLTGAINSTGGTVNNIGGTASLTANSGTTNLTGLNTYTGPTTISAGTLALTGSITSNVTNNATFNNAGTVTGSLTNTGITNNSGTITNGLTNTATVNASGIVNGAIANGTGMFTVTGAFTGNSTFTNAASATLAIGASGAYTLQGLLANSGIVTVANGGQLIATVGGITNTAGGSITVAAGGTVNDELNNAGVVSNGGAYVANVATNTGAGSITNTASGNWSGNVLSNAAAIVNSGTWTGNVVANTGTITNNLTWTGAIANAGTFNNNTGATVSGLLTNTGGTTTNNGALNGGANISGGAFTGAGTVTNLMVSGGTFAPGTGTPGSSMTVTGNLAFQSGAMYLVTLNPTTASFASVGGTAALNGTAAAVYLAGNYISKKYTILTAAGGVSGTFASLVNTNVPANFTSSLSYDANHAYIDLTLNFIPNPTPNFGSGLNINQQNVANTLVNFFNTTGGIPLVFGALTPGGLTIASGELGTGIIQSSIKANDMFLNLLLDPSVAGRAGGFAPGPAAAQFAADDEEALAYAAKRKASSAERDAYAMATKAPYLAPQPVNRWSVWGAAYGGSATTDGNAVVGSHDTTARAYGVVGGADYKVTPDALVGFALAGGGTSFSIASALGSGNSDLFQAGVFGRQNIGAAYLSAALAYGWQDVTTNRTVTVAGTDVLRASFKAETFSARFEGGHRFATPLAGITPYVAAQVISFNLPAYAEQVLAGIGTFALNYGAQTTTATRTELGLRTDKSFAVQDGIFTLRGRAAWAHDYNSDRAVTAVFQTLPGAAFVVNGARANLDGALVSAGAEMKWLNGFSLAATFEGEFSGNTTSYAGKGVAKYTW
jgi:uncharacterized protein with beta-barrel porin domain